MMGMTRSRLALIAVLVLASLAASACVGPASELGTNDSPCYLALPAAKGAVHGAGTFLGVRDITIAVVDTGLGRTKQRPAELDASLRKIKASICAVGYAGTFTASNVDHPWPPGVSSARRALVLVEQKNARVLVTLLLRREPIRLGKIG